MPFRRSFWKTNKNDWRARKKQKDAITNQKIRLKAFTNKDHHKDIYKEILDQIVKEKIDNIRELTDEINDHYLRYYFIGDTARKRFDDFNNGIEIFKEIQSGEIKLEETEKTTEHI